MYVCNSNKVGTYNFHKGEIGLILKGVISLKQL